jgi:2-methylcitrate dehydratase PrpD
MTGERRAAAHFGAFVATCAVPPEARRAAQAAWLDTIGVILAGSIERPARVVQKMCDVEGRGPCRVAGTELTVAPGAAALANGTAAHALDYDDMCFVSLAHPSAPLVPAALAAGELYASSGRDLLDAYAVGFEVECALGRSVNPSHYARGWHCTSTLGSVGAAAAVARLMRLDASTTAHALSIAASEASGLKENFGTMVKPLHAGLAARNGVTAALLAGGGFTASDAAIDGPQGFVAATSEEDRDLSAVLRDLGSRWEIVETGITVKLYPSCAATHPSLDALLDLRRRHGFAPDEVEAIEVTVDRVTPSVLIYPEPRSGLEAKFSMQFCLAAAAVAGHVGIDTFDDTRVADPAIRRLASRVTMRVDDTLGRSAPALTQAHVAVRLAGGGTLDARADGARGYPARPPSREELDAKFRACAARAIGADVIEEVLAGLHKLEEIADIRLLTPRLARRVPVAEST